MSTSPSSSSRECGVAVLGFGTVGAGVVETLLHNGDLLAARTGVRPVLRGIADLDTTTDRHIPDLPAGLLTTDSPALLARPDVHIVVELIGGTGIARRLVEQALALGKPVVTANKKLLAEAGPELYALAEANHTQLYFEASVGGGIPILKALREGLAANHITSIYGILNGTCNYILTRMEQEALPFATVLASAQQLGYAEAEPSLDIDGLDTAHKAAVLATLAYGAPAPLAQIPVQGIRDISPLDIQSARSLGYRIKLLAILRKGPRGIEASVQPTLLPLDHTLAAVSGVFNAVQVEGDVVGTTLYYGRGAGRAATASAVCADIADAALDLLAGAPRHPRSPAASAETPLPFAPPDLITARHYLRFNLHDVPGSFARVAACLANHDIGLESIIQNETPDDAPSAAPGYVPVSVTTQPAPAGALDLALAEIGATPDLVQPPITRFRIEALA
ncbi:MAG: homoserine dehydrogenase [Kiritimatiellae bacterium]|nr:homoserine dehydrogenase [Kiritimatiellia bacterium]